MGAAILGSRAEGAAHRPTPAGPTWPRDLPGHRRKRRMNAATAPKTVDIEVPVLIVGGGGAGLTCSMLLAQLGIESLLVSALPTTSILPKAHVLNQRTMEILGDVGVAK